MLHQCHTMSLICVTTPLSLLSRKEVVFLSTKYMQLPNSDPIQINQNSLITMLFVSRSFEYPFSEKKALSSFFRSFKELILSLVLSTCVNISMFWFFICCSSSSTNVFSLLKSFFRFTYSFDAEISFSPLNLFS
jgi:hypothetical protein